MLRFADPIMIGPERWIVTENAQPRIDCEMVTVYSSILFAFFISSSLMYAIMAIKHEFSIH